MAIQSKLVFAAEDGSQGRLDWNWKLVLGATLAAVGVAGIGYAIYSYQWKKDGAKQPTAGRAKVAVVAPQSGSGGASLDKTEKLKADGNAAFKRADYSAAVACYSNAIELIRARDGRADDKDDMLAACYQNRAAANEKLGKLDLVVDDCSAALEVKRTYEKAYRRRCEAYFNQEKYEEALHDITTVCFLTSFLNQPVIERADEVMNVCSKKTAKSLLLEKQQRPWDADVKLSTPQFLQYIRSFCEDPIFSPIFAEFPATCQPPQIDDELSAYEKARLYVALADYGKALEQASLEVEQEGDKALEALLLRATFALILGKSTETKRDLDAFFTLAEKSEGRSPDYLNKLKCNALIKTATLYMHDATESGDALMTNCLVQFEEAEKVEPTNVDVCQQRGQVMLLLGKIPNALEDFRKAAELRPDFDISLFQCCYAEVRQAREDEDVAANVKGMSKFEKLVEQRPGSAEGHALLGQLYAESGELEGAEAAFGKVLDLQPDNATIFVHMGLLELQKSAMLGQPAAGMMEAPSESAAEKARKCFLQAIDVDPRCQFAYETLGTLELQMNRATKGLEYMDKALELCRTSPEMEQILNVKAAQKAQSVAQHRLVGLIG